MTDSARIYAGSLYELCRDEGLAERVKEEISVVTALMAENPDLIRLLSLPSLPKKERCTIADTCFAEYVHTYLLSFIKILIERSAIAEFPLCAEEYLRLYRHENGIMAVTAITAQAIEEDLQKKLTCRITTAASIVLSFLTQALRFSIIRSPVLTGATETSSPMQ